MTTRVIAGADTWMEGEAVRQLQRTAQLPGIGSPWGCRTGIPVEAISSERPS